MNDPHVLRLPANSSCNALRLYLSLEKYYEKSNGTMTRIDHMGSLATFLLKPSVAFAAILASSCAFGQITMSLSPVLAAQALR